MRSGGRLRIRSRTAGDYPAFVRDLEPALLDAGHVHRFAVPPVALAGPGPPPAVRYLGGEGREAPDGTGAAWTVVVEPGHELHPQAVPQFARAAAVAGDASVITCDHDRLDRRGRRTEPTLRPGPSPDLLASVAPPDPVLAVRSDVLERVAVAERGWRHALLEATIGPAGQGHAHLPLVLAHAHHGAEPPVAGRRGGRDPVQPAGEPTIEVIVCLRDQPDLLERCARSLLSIGTYGRLRIRLVDNASERPETAELLDRLAADPRITVDHDPRPFNFSALNHAAAQRSDADVLVFLNNDTEIVDPDWIETLLAQALRPEVGAVAPMLLYPDGRVQHAGVAIGLHGWAGHPFAGLKPDQQTPFGAAADGTRNWMAVTAACLMVERRKYLEVGGFDPAFEVGGGDVDLCLRLTAAGYRSLCVPAATVIHDESATRDPAKIPPGDFEASRRSYGAFRTVGDPFYHPALTLQDTSCRLRRAGEPEPPP